jgi:uncharacterized cupredoxin-like copper-binding protein
MTDTTTTEPPEEPEGSGTEATTTAVAEPPEATPAPAEPEKVKFFDRPYVERYFTPLLLPVLVVAFVVVYVLNISRLFLSGHGHIPIIVGTIVTLLILLGSSLTSSAVHRLRQSFVILLAGLWVLAVVSGGWLVLGHSQEKGGGVTTLPPNLKTKQTLNVTAAIGGNLKFTPSQLTAKTGLATISVKVAAGGHTFDFDDSSTLFASLALTNSGSTVNGTAFFSHPGNYTFFCAIPGHRAAGMQGTITVTGPPVPTLDAALAQAGDSSADLNAKG